MNNLQHLSIFEKNLITIFKQFEKYVARYGKKTSYDVDEKSDYTILF